MGFHEVQFPTGISYGSQGGPGFNTAIVEIDSGAEERTARWPSSRRRYNATENVKTLTDLYDIQKFAIARDGPANGFLYFDWMDHASTADGRTTSTAGGAAAVTNLDQDIGIGDGTTTQFQLIKKYVSGPTTKTRTIKKPIAGTVVVSLNGVNQTSGWTVDTTTGIITFTVAPTAAVIIRAGFQFNVPVRFGKEVDDGIQASISGFNDGDIQDVPIVEIFDEIGADEDFYYGGSLPSFVMSADTQIALANGRFQIAAPNTSGLRWFTPVADNLPGGGPYLFLYNAGSFSVDVKTPANVLIKTLATSTGVELWLSVSALGVRTWYASA